MTASSVDEPTSITSRARQGTMPARIDPMFALPGAEPFDSSDHIFELMWAGARTMAHIHDGHVRLVARNGIDLAPFFPELYMIPGMLKADEAILDGEIIAIDNEGHPAFEALRPRLHAIAGGDPATPPPELMKPRKIEGQLCYQAFDLLWLDGRDTTRLPLWQRRNMLHNTLRPTAEFAAVDFVDDEGTAFFEAVLHRKLEGIVAKKKTSVYTPGRRSDDWQEIRALQSGDFVVGGYTFGGATRRGEPFRELLLGGFTADGAFEYVGAVSGGMNDAEARHLIALLEPLHRAGSPFADTPPLHRLVYWVRPELVCHVRFSEWARDGHLRFPIFSALRPDLDAAGCGID